MDFYDKALEALNQAGYRPELPLVFDGGIKRFKLESDDTKKSGWYIGYDEGERGFLVFADWKSGRETTKLCFAQSGFTDKKSMASAQRKLDSLERKARTDQKLRQETAHAEAEKIWRESLISTSHPYLTTKKLKSSYGARIWRDLLVLPVLDRKGKIWGLQTIDAKGTKLFTPGTKKKGCFFLIGEIESPKEIFLCEGFATGASLHQSDGCMVAVAFDAGNLKTVALELEKKYPGVNVVLAADRDEVGLQKAESAAQAVGGEMITPQFETENPKLTDFNDLMSTEGEEKVKEQIQTVRIKNVSDAFGDWFDEWCEQHELKPTYRGIYLCEGVERSLSYVQERLFKDARLFSRKFSEKDISVELGLQLQHFRDEYVKEIKTTLCKYDPSKVIELGAFVRAITTDIRDRDIAVMQHFLWQVKRKMMGLPVYHHMMPVLSGKSGSGKSVAIRKFLEPLKELMIEKQLDVVSDERQHNTFGDYYVIFLDEMAKAGKTDLEALKRVITSTELANRLLYSHKQNVFPNRSTMIGTTNNSLETVIKDQTSSRRWYQLDSRDLCDWDLVNKLNYIDVWQAVDPKSECPILPFMDQIKTHQEQHRYKSNVEEFVHEFEMVPDNGSKISTETIYKFYTEWSKDNGLVAFDKIYFGKQIAALGFESIQCGDRVKRTKGFKCLLRGVPVELINVEENQAPLRRGET